MSARDAPREVGVLRTLARIERNDIDVDDAGCAACGTQLNTAAKFCSDCGSPVATSTQSAEYKQFTILFADVVHSMDLAAAVGPERLREIMTELVSARPQL